MKTNVVDGKNGQARQGDILVVPISKEMFDSVTKYGHKQEDGIVAYGEGTGHNHVLVGDFDLVSRFSSPMVARVGEGVILQHTSGEFPDHDPIALGTGYYMFIRQFDRIGDTNTYVRD